MLLQCYTVKKFGKLSSGHRTGKGKFSSQSQRKAMPKSTVALISHASKVMLKILQDRLQQYVNCELPDVQAGFWKGRSQRNQRSNCQYPLDNQKSKRVPEKLLLYWLCQRLWLGISQQTVENSSRDENTRPLDLSPEKSVCRSRSNS